MSSTRSGVKGREGSVAMQKRKSAIDHVEDFEAGDGFYVGPGHSPSAVAGTEYVMFSPSDQMAPVNEAIERNLREAHLLQYQPIGR